MGGGKRGGRGGGKREGEVEGRGEGGVEGRGKGEVEGRGEGEVEGRGGRGGGKRGGRGGGKRGERWREEGRERWMNDGTGQPPSDIKNFIVQYTLDAIAGQARLHRGSLLARSIDTGVGSNVIWQVYTDVIASDLNIIKYCSPLALSVFSKEVWVFNTIAWQYVMIAIVARAKALRGDSSESHRVR